MTEQDILFSALLYNRVQKTAQIECTLGDNIITIWGHFESFKNTLAILIQALTPYIYASISWVKQILYKSFVHTRNISLKPLKSSRTTFLIWGTSLNIRRGLKQRNTIKSWVPDLAGTLYGIQHRKIRLTWKSCIDL